MKEGLYSVGIYDVTETHRHPLPPDELKKLVDSKYQAMDPATKKKADELLRLYKEKVWAEFVAVKTQMDKLEPLFADFQQDLKTLSEDISKRNDSTTGLKFKYLDPANVPSALSAWFKFVRIKTTILT